MIDLNPLIIIGGAYGAICCALFARPWIGELGDVLAYAFGGVLAVFLVIYVEAKHDLRMERSSPQIARVWR